MGTQFRELAAPAISKPGDLASVLTVLKRGDVFLLDEIHALDRRIAEILYGAMEDFRVSILGENGKELLKLPVERFTLVGATTDLGLLPEPLQARFGEKLYLDLYTQQELEQVIARAADLADVLMDKASVTMIAARARGTPRNALRLFRRARDLAIVKDADLFSDITQEAMDLLGIDALGLDAADRKYLRALVEIYGGGPVGPKGLVASTGLDKATLEQTVEAWLVRSGLVARTFRGRKITPKGYEHIAASIPSGLQIAFPAAGEFEPVGVQDEDD